MHNVLYFSSLLNIGSCEQSSDFLEQASQPKIAYHEPTNQSQELRGALFLLVFGFSALSAEKPNTDDRKVPERSPQAEAASNLGHRLSPVNHSCDNLHATPDC
jgi:hypothetical protein